MKEKPIVTAEKLHIVDGKNEFWEVVDHAFQYGNVYSNDDYFCLWYELPSKEMNCKKCQKSLDNSKAIYISSYAGDLKKWFEHHPNKDFEWICFRRHFNDERLRTYKFDKIKRLILNELS
tara:strand:+ start:404 stop:763 length:360 start_codon:yes stop_codon:yes gene_type:complete